MFRRATTVKCPVTFEFCGEEITAEEGDTIAAALLAAGILDVRRSAEDGSVRGPFCMIGNCFECLVVVEGVGSRQACRERVKQGLRVRRHLGKIQPGACFES